MKNVKVYLKLNKVYQNSVRLSKKSTVVCLSTTKMTEKLQPQKISSKNCLEIEKRRHEQKGG